MINIPLIDEYSNQLYVRDQGYVVFRVYSCGTSRLDLQIHLGSRGDAVEKSARLMPERGHQLDLEARADLLKRHTPYMDLKWALHLNEVPESTC